MKTRTKGYMKVICAFLALSLACALTGCMRRDDEQQVIPVTDDIFICTYGPAPDLPLYDQADEVTDFAVRLMQTANDEGQSTLISPLSVMIALAMTANGADGGTREEMEQVLGMSCEELNGFLSAYLSSLGNDDGCALSCADSIWIKDDGGVEVSEDFLETTEEYYGSEVHTDPFDESAAGRINGWVKEKTNGLIDSIIDRIPSDAFMYLVNALVFEAEWESVYKESQIGKGVFTKEDGTETNCEYMYCSEGRYLSDGHAKGFVKYYSGGRFAFAVLLPGEGMTVAEYLTTLTGDGLSEMLGSDDSRDIRTAIPKFESGTKTELSGCLKEMGMPEAFDGTAADFSRLGTTADGKGRICIGRVLHRTYIKVDEAGTKAGAATAVEMLNETAAVAQEPEKIYLDRPFVYMLIDCERNIPFFIGTMTDPSLKG